MCFFQFVFPALHDFGLSFGVFFELRQASFHVFDPLISIAVGLAQLTPDLHASLVDAFFDRVEITLHLLNIGTRIRKGRA